ncbi:MAG: Na(+)-translocating NADH-quinone reductase subunit A [Bacteroides sp. SM23_62]|nr:MAG: Na(+)-translocating NADH-quinone reductase subunit A [Bacteroides sp. SM23_62]
MSKVIKIKKGLDIKLKGAAEKIISNVQPASTYAVKPTDFPGIVPKLAARPGDKVKAGSILFFDKLRPEVKFASPVSGEVKAVNRGERRKILEIVVDADGKNEYEEFGAADPVKLDREQIVMKIQDAGLWPCIRQRPYAVIARSQTEPKAIFISGFDTAPLAPDMDFVVKGNNSAFQTGINALNKLTRGEVHLSLQADNPAADVFTRASGVSLHYFKGPHPAGNPGVQIHHIDPVNKDEVVWYIQPQEVIMIGRLFEKGIYDATRVIAVTGSEVKKPRYFRVLGGASIEPYVMDNVNPGELRYISGNALTGSRISKIGYIGFYDSQLTVLPEGNYYEMFGWMAPGFKKLSVSRSFPSWLMPGREYKVDTNLKGGARPFVQTGEYEKVLPMNIYPMHLLKAILVDDIEKMEQLGIYEVAEEDFALCEFVCPSKIEIQSIIRQGIDLMIKELE